LEASLRITLGIAVAAMALCSASALAEETSTTTNARDVVICKRVPSATGTRLGATKECHTQREWDERRVSDRELTERAQEGDSRGSTGN
jgi:hypothetical protein